MSAAQVIEAARTLPSDWLDWLAALARASQGRRGYPIVSLSPAGGHLIVVAEPGRVQARCACGWTGPDRTGDDHVIGLVLDDVAWHCHELGMRCPEHRPDQAAECLTCARREQP